MARLPCASPLESFHGSGPFLPIFSPPLAAQNLSAHILPSSPVTGRTMLPASLLLSEVLGEPSFFPQMLYDLSLSMKLLFSIEYSVMSGVLLLSNLHHGNFVTLFLLPLVFL